MVPSEVDVDDTGTHGGEGGEHGVREVEVLLRGVAPAALAAAGAEVGGRDGDGFAAAVAALGFGGQARQLIACSACIAVSEQGATQSRRPGAVPCAV